MSEEPTTVDLSAARSFPDARGAAALCHRSASGLSFAGRACLTLILVLGLARAPLAQIESPIELLHADQFTVELTEDGNAYHARGNVKFRQGTADLQAQMAIWFEATREVHLFGDVRVVDTGEVLDADTLIYIAGTDRAFAYGHVEYARPTGSLTAFGDRGEYHRAERWALLYDNARMIYQEQDSTGRIDVWADTLWFYPDADSVDAVGHVTVRRADGTATAQRAVFAARDDADRVLLLGAPEGTFRDNDVAGDTLQLVLEGGELVELHALGAARANFKETSAVTGRTTESDLSSRRMVLGFEEGALSTLTAIDEARSRYLPAWGRPGERNDASGDTVRIDIVDSVIHRVQVIGGAQGTYYSPREDGDGEDSIVSLDTIQYLADYIDYRVDQNWIRLWDHAQIDYGTVTLTAGQVLYETEVAVLRAYALGDTLLPPPADYRGPDAAGPPDSAGVDSLQAGWPQRVPPASADQQPVLRDGAQEVEGRRLVYDIQTQRGRIIRSATETEDGYYRGGDFRKESPNTFFVRNGHYTTCELEDPHFEFIGGRMKIREGDRVFARPVVLKIEELPVLWIPYYVFSIKKDRHSGLLPIRFGNFERGSRYVRNIGYYFAISDYWDFAPALDVVEGQGVLWNLRGAYALRYKLSGAFYGSYNKHTAIGPTGEQTSTRWNLLFSHNQQLSPSLNLAGSGNFVSDNSFYQDFTADPYFRLNRRLRSQVNLNKRWRSASLILAADDSRNLDDDSRQSLLPRYALTIPAWQLFTPRKLKGGRREDRRWYHEFRVGFNSIGQHLITDARSFRDTLIDTVLLRDTVVTRKQYITMDHRFNLGYSTKIGGVFSLTPSFNLQETWYYVFEPRDDTLPTGVDAETFARRLSGSFSISTQTNLYGIFPLRAGALDGFRHVFTPSLSFSMSPPITQSTEYRLYTGSGGGGTVRSRVMGIGVGNLFQMKTRSGETEKRWDLLNIGISTSYNFEAQQRNWSNISTNIRSGLLRNPDISIALVHDPYDPETGRLDWKLRLRSVSTNIGFRLAGRGGSGQQSSYAGGGTYYTEGGADYDIPGGSPGGFGRTGGGVRSWNFSASYQFSEVRSPSPTDPRDIIKTTSHWIRPNLRFNPTPNWEVQTNLYYDIKNQTMNDWTVRLQRDLHCWQGEFSWVITGPRAGYYFRINVKRLSDLKFEKSESGIRDALFGAIPGL